MLGFKFLLKNPVWFNHEDKQENILNFKSLLWGQVFMSTPLYSFQQIKQFHLPPPPSLPLYHCLLTEITVLPLSFQKPVQVTGTNLTVTWVEGPLTEHDGVWDKCWALRCCWGEGEVRSRVHPLKKYFFYLTMENFLRETLILIFKTILTISGGRKGHR